MNRIFESLLIVIFVTFTTAYSCSQQGPTTASVTLEALSVPIAAARAWLREMEVPDVADVEGLSSSLKDVAPD